MPIVSLSTLGCPAWTLDEVLRRMPAFGADAVDFRGVAEGLDITTLPAFTADLAATARRIADSGLAVSGVSSGISICDPAKAEANIEEARRTIPVALALKAPMVRVFGGGPVTGENRAELARLGSDTLGRIVSLPGAEKIDWLLETHDHWISSKLVLGLLDPVREPNVGVLWDIAHTQRYTDESPEALCSVYGKRIRNIHIKDAVKHGDDWKYVAPGEGELRIGPAVETLFAHGYAGPVTLEHEKRWHAELADPEIIFPCFVKWARGLRLPS